MNTRRFVQTALLLFIDIIVFGGLYLAFGLTAAIVVCIGTKAFGLVVVLARLPRYLRLRQSSKVLNEKLRLRHDNSDFVLSDQDMHGLRNLMFVGIYNHVVAFMLVPGPLSDLIGGFLVFPPTSDRLLDMFMDMAWQAQRDKVQSLR
ncbi:Uncharacterised protein [BD1-7 clade bacterium]|uniref:Uncharacterized protein n=1 Tax=BD1-7 clade bacterium TaxID=2029982 RepID=A0A5S9QTZ1_9GAMM|nr:Uncharacterised protein [BD1-7 clade bacterium]CAA0122898.1 Uncharacterised protein [BD1-7 clade bacterium]